MSEYLLKEEKFTDIWSDKMTIPIPAIDIVVFTIYKDELCVVLNQIKSAEKLTYVLPGGIVTRGYSLEENFDNILKRKTDLTGVYKEQLYTFGDPSRDKRGHTLSISYFALVGSNNLIRKVDFTKVDLIKYSELDNSIIGNIKKKIGYDHLDIIKYAKQRLKWKLEYTNIAKDLLSEEFRISQLQYAYETILGEKLDKRNFQKKIFKLKMLEETGDLDKTTNRPAKLYRFIDTELTIYEVL